MSPVSRRRKKTKTSSTGQRVIRPVVTGECDCPACSGAEFDPQELVDAVVAGAGDLAGVDDPLEAELFGAGMVASGDPAGEGFEAALAESVVPALEARGSAEALAVLLTVDAVTEYPAAPAATRRLLEAGIAAPVWAAELAEPVRPGSFLRFADPAGEGSVLLASFVRAGRSHGFAVNVDELDCHAAADVVLIPGEAMAEAAAMIRKDALADGVSLTEEELDAAEFRWQAERALAARAVHDSEDAEAELTDETLDYLSAAVLLEARLRTLPELPRPLPEHG